MADTVINVQGLGKKYKIGGPKRQPYLTLRDTLSGLFRKPSPMPQAPSPDNAPCPKPHAPDKDFWALHDVNFTVGRGEVVGVIGRNGAGKSTLLKILSRITEPTEGRIEIRGRVGSLLEVGTGFHPELSGRENIFLNGAILGMSKKEIARKFDEIVTFAEIEKFLDTPVKHYSSGMYVRLAFAVAAHLEPEILLVDEVLAVGDVQFQKKCLGKMGEVARSGRTVLFVSHNMEAVRRLCSRVMVLADGQVVADGSVAKGISLYMGEGAEDGSAVRVFQPEEVFRDGVCLERVRIIDGKGCERAMFRMDEEICFEYSIMFQSSVPNFHMYTRIVTEDGVVLLGSGDWDDDNDVQRAGSGRMIYTCRLPGRLLNQGKYYVTVQGMVPDMMYYFDVPQVVRFEVNAMGGVGGSTSSRRPGIIRPLLQWSMHRENGNA